MAIKQLTVFVENRKGTMVSVTDILSQNNVLQAVIDITGVGKFNASFIFDVELN